MIIESGVVVALGLIFIFIKLSWRWRLRMLGFPVTLDIGTFVFLNWLHSGTFSGLMVAAVGALVCSALISIGRKMFGYIERGKYIAGRINVYDRIK
jgi:hypothetical protein